MEMMHIQARVRKQTRYDSLIKLVVLVIKKLGLYKRYKDLAMFYKMKYQRNYTIIFFGICLIEQELIKKGWAKDNIINFIFGLIEQNLENVLQERYSKSQHSAQLIKMTKEKNVHDLGVIKSLFLMQEYDEIMVEKQLNSLYKTRYNLHKRKGNTDFNDNTFAILQYFRHANTSQPTIKQQISHTKDIPTQQQLSQTYIKQEYIQEQAIKQQDIQNSIRIKQHKMEQQENQFKFSIHSAFQRYRAQNLCMKELDQQSEDVFSIKQQYKNNIQIPYPIETIQYFIYQQY